MKLLSGLAAIGAAAAFATTASADLTVIEDFAEPDSTDPSVIVPSFGQFTFGAGPSGSGSNTGDSAGTTGVSDPFPFVADTFVNSLSITDDNFIAPNGGLDFGEDTAWNFRHVANGGSAGTVNTVSATGATGWFGFYLRTTDPDLKVLAALDEASGGTGGTEASTFKDVIADGEWHLYQWDLSDSSQWRAFVGGSDGVLDGSFYTLDSINFYNFGPEDGETSSFDLAYVSYSASDPIVNVVPEPTTLAMLGGLAGLALRRRRSA